MQSREFSPFLQVLNERDLSIHWCGFALRAIDSAINGARQNVGRFTDLGVPAVLTPQLGGDRSGPAAGEALGANSLW
jgi:hypothetical protein